MPWEPRAQRGPGTTFGDDVVWWRVAGALGVSLLLQIGVNYANDYSDGVRGTDDVRVGPLRLVATGIATPGAVKRGRVARRSPSPRSSGWCSPLATSWWLLVVGAAAILAAWGYTGGPEAVRLPRAWASCSCSSSSVWSATVGTTYVAIERVPGITWIAASGVGFLACALLVINNLRDIPTDREVGKRTLAVRLGDRRTRRLYAGLVVGGVRGCRRRAAGDAAAGRLLALVRPVDRARRPLPRRARGCVGPRPDRRSSARPARRSCCTGSCSSVGLALG